MVPSIKTASMKVFLILDLSDKSLSMIIKSALYPDSVFPVLFAHIISFGVVVYAVKACSSVIHSSSFQDLLELLGFRFMKASIPRNGL